MNYYALQNTQSWYVSKSPNGSIILTRDPNMIIFASSFVDIENLFKVYMSLEDSDKNLRIRREDFQIVCFAF